MHNGICMWACGNVVILGANGKSMFLETAICNQRNALCYSSVFHCGLAAFYNWLPIAVWIHCVVYCSLSSVYVQFKIEFDCFPTLLSLYLAGWQYCRPLMTWALLTTHRHHPSPHFNHFTLLHMELSQWNHCVPADPEHLANLLKDSLMDVICYPGKQLLMLLFSFSSFYMSASFLSVVVINNAR